MNFELTILIASALYLIALGFIMYAGNLLSTLLFKVLPCILGFTLLFLIYQYIL